jgi:hypothetical protein
MQDPVTYILILALIMLPLVMLVWFMADVLEVVWANQTIMLSYPFS